MHRRAVAEVFLTDVVQDAPDRFRVAAQWPRAHSFYVADTSQRRDPMLAVELVRQTALLLAHRPYGVPEGHQFVFTDLDYELLDPAGLATTDAPAEVVLNVTAAVTARRKEIPAALQLATDIEVDGVLTARVAGGLRCMPPSTYNALRRRSMQQTNSPCAEVTAADHAPLLHRARADLLLGTVTHAQVDTTSYALRVDQAHPVLFDHPLDHVPGMLQVEALRQAAHAASGRSGICTSLGIQFLQFAELTNMTSVHVQDPSTRGAQQPLAVSITQNDVAVSHGKVTVS